MTKETKVGLLVGLAFVIVIGIYLSDHASNTNQAPQAPLALSISSVRGAIGDLGGEDSPVVVKVPANVVPKNRVPTRNDLKPHKMPPGVRLDDPIRTVTPTGNGDTRSELEKKAAEMGEPLVPADPTNPIQPQPPVQPERPSTQVARSYIAQPGDSLGTIAKKAYGSSCLANRKAIMAANPFMADNQDMIVAGKTYVIPPVATASISPPSPSIEQPSAAPTSALTLYTVQPGDTLWSIAKNQVGSTAAVSTIIELNKDVLHGSNRVRESMRLRLPKRAA